MEFKLGDSIIVKQGTKEPDYGEFEIGGWEGRIIEIDTTSDKDNTLITIEWDSHTLNEIPSSYIEKSEIEGYEWKYMTLWATELEKTKPRDSNGKVKKIQNKLSDKYFWTSLGYEGIRISKVLGGVNPKDEMMCLQKWVDHLDKKLTFPIQAIVTDSNSSWIIRAGEKVLIKSLPHIVDLYGVIASIKMDNGKRYEFPLCDLEVIDKNSPDYQLIDDYRTWFGNR